LPLLFGVGILFVNGRSILGWLLAVGGLLFILAGILINLDIYFERTTLMNTLVMLVMIAAGFGLIVKGLRPHKTA
jgi:cytochrome c oxidase subunit IV